MGPRLALPRELGAQMAGGGLQHVRHIKRGWKPGRATTYSHIGQLPNWELTIWLSVWPCNAPVATAVQRSSILTIWLFYHAAAPHKGAATALALYLPFPSAMLLGVGYRIIYI